MAINNIKRILIVRTDRIGDVVLSTPTITAARAAFRDAYIAVMVSPQTREIVENNPHINEIIIYDKKERHKGVLETLRFSIGLRKKAFDVAFILHSTNRVNVISFLAGIPRRIGYARGKINFLLTDKLDYNKRLGEKHEAEYSLDVLRAVGVKAEMSPLMMPVKKSDKESIEALLKAEGLQNGENFVVLHPGASCVSKMWPKENFAECADKLIDRFGVKPVLISSEEQVWIGEGVQKIMKNTPMFLCGKTSLGGLSALFKEASLFISNDSGPVHIACAVGIPVISIFGRNEKGLSPKRWGPIGAKGTAVHKDVGCTECLAHKCRKDFLCLKSITVEEIIKEASKLLCQ